MPIGLKPNPEWPVELHVATPLDKQLFSVFLCSPQTILASIRNFPSYLHEPQGHTTWPRACVCACVCRRWERLGNWTRAERIKCAFSSVSHSPSIFVDQSWRFFHYFFYFVFKCFAFHLLSPPPPELLCHSEHFLNSSACLFFNSIFHFLSCFPFFIFSSFSISLSFCPFFHFFSFLFSIYFIFYSLFSIVLFLFLPFFLFLFLFYSPSSLSFIFILFSI